MPSRSSSQWQSRRKPSLGKLRRAHPASGATWNVQVVRGKMTSKCLWHACRALALGMVLMLLGAGMATIGYYADQLSIGQEIRGNATVRVKNESRGFHLNNLSYAGPIIMGFGGFIVVAACVMTFEARDSAAKVVPARFKLSTSSRGNIRSNTSSATSTRRANGIMQQSTRWDHHLGVFRTSPADPPAQLDRQALTAALIHFSKALGNSPRQSPSLRRFSRSGSVPNLATSHRSSMNSSHLSPFRKQTILGHSPQHHHHHHQHHGRNLSNASSSRISSSFVHRSSRESTGSLLHPGMLQYHRHALSVDESGPYFVPGSESPHASQPLVPTIDSHEGRIKDRTIRSDTARKHVLARQKPIEKEEPNSPKTAYGLGRRRSSTASDASYASRRMFRRASSVSRTPSIDSRSVQVDLHSPDQFRSSPHTPRRFNSGQSSTPSVEREFRSQLSVCSEPVTVRQLSGQSSLEPCVLEESPEFEEKEFTSDLVTEEDKSQNSRQSKKARPGSLHLESNPKIMEVNKTNEAKKCLYRSNSSRTFYRPKPRLINEYDQIYFISSNGSVSTSQPHNTEDDFYDSLQVINERRKKILELSSQKQMSEPTVSSFSSSDHHTSGNVQNTNPNEKIPSSLAEPITEESQCVENNKDEVTDPLDSCKEIKANGTDPVF